MDRAMNEARGGLRANLEGVGIVGSALTLKQAQRLAFLHRETLREWWIRQFERWGLPAPSEAEIAELIRLGEIDVRDGHQ